MTILVCGRAQQGHCIRKHNSHVCETAVWTTTSTVQHHCRVYQVEAEAGEGPWRVRVCV